MCVFQNFKDHLENHELKWSFVFTMKKTRRDVPTLQFSINDSAKRGIAYFQVNVGTEPNFYREINLVWKYQRNSKIFYISISFSSM